MLSLNDYYYNLPAELVAEYPAGMRTNSKLLCLKKSTGEIQHKNFSDLISFLNAGDLLVLNDTKVIPARMFGIKETGGSVEIFLERVISKREALVHLRASKSPKVGSKISVAAASLEVINKDLDSGLYKLAIVNDISSGIDDNSDCLDFRGLFQNNGTIPLPPYIKRAVEVEDNERYQTVYAAEDGSVAAPTAGLHFDNILLNAIEAKGVKIAKITLHIGSGTFVPVKVENIQEHKIHSEFIEINTAVCELVEATRKNHKRVIAVGTTAVRALEAAATVALQKQAEGQRQGVIVPYSGDTNIFITPGFKFNVVDAMITNFHLPKSTLLMLVAAFAGYDNAMSAYKNAIDAKYRFYSYGDAMFIE